MAELPEVNLPLKKRKASRHPEDGFPMEEEDLYLDEGSSSQSQLFRPYADLETGSVPLPYDHQHSLFMSSSHSHYSQDSHYPQNFATSSSSCYPEPGDDSHVIDLTLNTHDMPQQKSSKKKKNKKVVYRDNDGNIISIDQLINSSARDGSSLGLGSSSYQGSRGMDNLIACTDSLQLNYQSYGSNPMGSNADLAGPSQPKGTGGRSNECLRCRGHKVRNPLKGHHHDYSKPLKPGEMYCPQIGCECAECEEVLQKRSVGKREIKKTRDYKAANKSH